MEHTKMFGTKYFGVVAKLVVLTIIVEVLLGLSYV